MRKMHMLVMVAAAVCTLSAIAVSTASAADQWLDLAGKAVTSAVQSLTDGEITFHHTSILGIVNIACTGQFHGTVGGLTGKEDLITDVLGLGGELNEKIHCEVTTSGLCKAGELALLKAEHLPWNTKLETISIEGVQTLGDHIFADGNGLPAYEAECVVAKIKVLCEGLDFAKWDENVATGSLFLFQGKIPSATCSDGGSSTTLGHGIILDFFVS